LQFTLTITGLTATEAEALECALEEGSPLAVSRNEIDEERNRWELVAYFASEEEARGAARLLPGVGNIAVAPLPDTDWVRHSLEGLPTVAAGRFFLYGSHDRDKRRAGGISLEIDAGTAFGTGHHATTQGCLLALDALLKWRKPRRILDVGCGTGVLALAAAKALHAAALASDIDPEAIRVARVNAHVNGVFSLLNAVVASGLAHPLIRACVPYDLIFANILARPLIGLAQPISRALAPGGTLILSGMTRGQARAILAAYRNRGLIPIDKILRDSWSTLVLTKPNTRSIAAPGVEKHPDRFRAAG
jgi:ribosomal protein L11 methyltransferase